MNIRKIKREETNLFSSLANKLVYQQSDLKDFIQAPFSKEAFEAQINLKKDFFTKEKRDVLVRELTKNYSSRNTNFLLKNKIESLGDENTFTVTTGHQLSILTGPLYFIVKILHVIELAKELKDIYPNQNFVPVFWMASEDHDFEEIQTAHLFNQSFKWESEQEGPVGRFDMTNWKEYIDTIKALFANHPECEVEQVLDTYTGRNLSEATFNLVHSLFGNQGLVILDADNTELKKAMQPVVKGELNDHKSFKAVEKTNEALSEIDLSAQAHAREVNLFFLEKGLRTRIKAENGKFVIDGKGEFSADDIQAMFEKDPTCISPNVILRPMYQEMILPNLCYVGGGGEIAYWLQLKGVFDAYAVPYPLIQVRNSIMLIDETTSKKMENVAWKIEDLFKDLDALKKSFVLANSNELEFDLLQAKMKDLQEVCTNMALSVDPNMKGFVEAEMTRLTKQMDNFEQKLIRAEKAKHDKSLKQMDQVKDRLFPNGGLQERYQNFFHFCADGNVFSHLNEIQACIEPFEEDFIISKI